MYNDFTTTLPKVGDLIAYYLHTPDKSKGKVCVCAFDFHGNLSLFFGQNHRWVIGEESRPYMQYLGNVKDNRVLIPDYLQWAENLVY